MQQFYLKGKYEDLPCFIMIIVRVKKVRVEIITYNEGANMWSKMPKTFDLNNEEHIRAYNNFRESFFESDEMEYKTAKRCLPMSSQTALPKKADEPIMTIDELLTNIKQFEASRKNKNGN